MLTISKYANATGRSRQYIHRLVVAKRLRFKVVHGLIIILDSPNKLPKRTKR